MADDLIPQFQLTPVDYDPFSADYALAQQLALASIGGGMVGLPVMKSLLAPTEGENK